MSNMRKQKNENICIFYFGLKNEQIKATLKCLSIQITFLCQLLVGRNVSDETAPIRTSKYSVSHSLMCV
jgi:hypothetical protein